MRVGNAIESLTKALANHKNYDMVMLWQQCFESTTLCFGGIGGCAMTIADVALVEDIDDRFVYIYVDGRLAAKHSWTDLLLKDCMDRNIHFNTNRYQVNKKASAT